MRGRWGLLVCVALALAALAAPAGVEAKSGAARLSIPDARERAAMFAERTCNHDERCASAGVQSCRRHRSRVVFCRIFDHRKTKAQGNFVCTRLIRLSMHPLTGRIPVTGVGGWSC